MQKAVGFYESKHFLRHYKKVLGEEGRTELHHRLAANPMVGDVIPGAGGVRKLRWARPGMGKRGGARVIYYYVDSRNLVALLTVYAKSEKKDVSKGELKLWAEFAQRIKKGESDA